MRRYLNVIYIAQILDFRKDKYELVERKCLGS